MPMATGEYLSATTDRCRNRQLLSVECQLLFGNRQLLVNRRCWLSCPGGAGFIPPPPPRHCALLRALYGRARQCRTLPSSSSWALLSPCERSRSSAEQSAIAAPWTRTIAVTASTALARCRWSTGACVILR